MKTRSDPKPLVLDPWDRQGVPPAMTRLRAGLRSQDQNGRNKPHFILRALRVGRANPRAPAQLGKVLVGLAPDLEKRVYVEIAAGLSCVAASARARPSSAERGWDGVQG